MPVYLVPGNHDRRAELFAEFGSDGYLKNDDGFLHYTIEGHEVRLIGLDTVVPGHGHGEMCAKRLAWLEGAAGRAARPADPGLHAPSAVQHRPRRHGQHQLPQRPGDGGRAAPRRQYRARGLRPPSSPHHRYAGAARSARWRPAPPIRSRSTWCPTAARRPSRMEPPGFHMHLSGRKRPGLVTHGVRDRQVRGPFPFLLEADYPGHTAKAEAA